MAPPKSNKHPMMIGLGTRERAFLRIMKREHQKIPATLATKLLSEAIEREIEFYEDDEAVREEMEQILSNGIKGFEDV